MVRRQARTPQPAQGCTGYHRWPYTSNTTSLLASKEWGLDVRERGLSGEVRARVRCVLDLVVRKRQWVTANIMDVVSNQSINRPHQQLQLQQRTQCSAVHARCQIVILQVNQALNTAPWQWECGLSSHRLRHASHGLACFTECTRRLVDSCRAHT